MTNYVSNSYIGTSRSSIFKIGSRSEGGTLISKPTVINKYTAANEESLLSAFRYGDTYLAAENQTLAT